MSVTTVVEQELDRLYAANEGKLSDRMVIEAATPEDSPLHAAFEWDDTVAGHMFRMAQARSLIRSVKIRVVTRDASHLPEVRRINEFVAASRVLSTAEPGTYLKTSELDPAQRTILLQRMQREMTALRRRYAHLAEYWDLLDREISANSPSRNGTEG